VGRGRTAAQSRIEKAVQGRQRRCSTSCRRSKPIRTIRSKPPSGSSPACRIRPRSNTLEIRPITARSRIASPCPPRELFASPEAIYATAFHELGHATGSPRRLNRESIAEAAPFGSPTYSFEELVAEFLAAYLCAEAGISPAVLQNQAAYIQGWLTKLRNDRRMMVIAASQAQKAADYVLNRQSAAEAKASAAFPVAVCSNIQDVQIRAGRGESSLYGFAGCRHCLRLDCGGLRLPRYRLLASKMAIEQPPNHCFKDTRYSGHSRRLFGIDPMSRGAI
jgi:hypothetical protein